jgi:hypothetical protein
MRVFYDIDQDEDGRFCASATLRPGVGAVGDGADAAAALADLRRALVVLEPGTEIILLVPRAGDEPEPAR